MKYLLPGAESEARFDLLLELTSIRSEEKIGALKQHYCKGATEETACWLFDLDISNFRKACQTVETVAAKVEKIKELDWRGLVK